jgi:hypothetical protein
MVLLENTNYSWQDPILKMEMNKKKDESQMFVSLKLRHMFSEVSLFTAATCPYFY